MSILRDITICANGLS